MTLDSPFLHPDDKTGKYLSLSLAVFVHIVLAMFLFYGVHWQTKMPNVVEVELVSTIQAPPARTIIEPIAKPVTEPLLPAPPKAENKLPAPTKPDIVIKEKIKEPPKKIVEPTPVEPPVPDTPKKPSIFEQLKKEADQLLQRKKSDAVTAQLTKEAAARETASRNKAMADYLSRIRGKIRGNIVLPPDVQGNPEAVFDVTQLPNGEIVTTRLRHSSGSTALDTAIERAILKSNPLPKPDKPDLYNRTLELSFRPLDE